MGAERSALADALGAWDEIREALRAAGDGIHLFADFDGALSPIVHVPAAAGIDPDVKIALTQLALDDCATVAVLSGRSVPDIAARVGLPVAYAGDHGLEIHGPDFEFAVPGADSYRRELPYLCNQIRDGLRRFPGALVEGKRLTASVHYRQVPPEQLPELACAVDACVNPERFEVSTGECAFEIVPRLGWDKGDAAAWLLARSRARPEQTICFGHASTDEEVFTRFPNAINIRVGYDGTRSAARYWVAQSEVAQLLLNLLAFVRARRSSPRRSAIDRAGTRRFAVRHSTV